LKRLDVSESSTSHIAVGRHNVRFTPKSGHQQARLPEAEQKAKADAEAANRRATDAQVLEDAERLIAAWNERQAKRMPILFRTSCFPITSPYNVSNIDTGRDKSVELSIPLI
jgi:hypothetical protein